MLRNTLGVGRCEALLVDWLLEQRGANSKTDPSGSVFLLPRKQKERIITAHFALSLRLTDDNRNAHPVRR